MRGDEHRWACGQRDGAAVRHRRARHRGSPGSCELRDFTKLDLAPGQSRSATFELTARDLSYWSETMHDWVLEAGEFEFAVGSSSSRNLELRSTVYVDAPRVAPLLDPMSSWTSG